MKWKKLNESVNAAADELEGLEEPIKIKDIDQPEYPSSDSWDKDASDIDYLIDEYINDQARKYYTNGNIPENEEQEMRESMNAVRIFFDYWCEADDEYDAGYEEREALFIIDDDGWLCNLDFFGEHYSTEEWNYLVNSAFRYAKIPYKGSSCPD